MSANRRSLILGLSLSLAAFVAAPATAGAPMEGGLTPYFEIDGHGSWINAPSIDGAGSTLLGVGPAFPRHAFPTTDTDIESWGGGFDIRTGFVVPDRIVPSLTPQPVLDFFDGWRAEFAVSYDEANEHATSERAIAFEDEPPPGPPPPVSAQFWFPVRIDGNANFMNLVILGLPTQAIDTDFDAQYQSYDVRLQGARALDFLPGIGEKVRFGFMGGEIDADYVIKQTVIGEINGNFGNGRNELSEELESFFLGPVMGFALDMELVEKVSAFVEVELALLYHHARLDAHQTYNGEHIVGNSFCGPIRCTFNASEKDEEDHFTARPSLRAGVDYDFGWATLGVTGSFTYWSYMPAARNPGLGPLQGFNNLFNNKPIGKAHLTSADGMTAEIGMRLVIPFGGS